MHRKESKENANKQKDRKKILHSHKVAKKEKKLRFFRFIHATKILILFMLFVFIALQLFIPSINIKNPSSHDHRNTLANSVAELKYKFHVFLCLKHFDSYLLRVRILCLHSSKIKFLDQMQKKYREIDNPDDSSLN